MSVECEDKIDIFDEEELETMSKKTLESILALVKNCKDCDGCIEDIKMLEMMISEMEK